MNNRMSTYGTLVVFITLFLATPARADVPLSHFVSESGAIDSFMTGMSLATDGPDADTNVDQLSLPASVVVTSSDVPTNATLLRAFLYWGGTQADGVSPDFSVTLSYPSGGPTSITADVCYSDVASTFYDMYLCRAEITSILHAAGSAITGTFTVDNYRGLVSNGSADNASAAVVLIFSAPDFSHRTVLVDDGLMMVQNNSVVISSSGFSIEAPSGELTFYTMEGDTGGLGIEQIAVQGLPSGGTLVLSDAVNPSTNPMNHTINMTSPVQTDVIGVDIDRFTIDASLTASDTDIDATYTAGTDKWWLGVQIVGVRSVCPSSVPTISEWGMIILFVLLVGSAVWVMRRKIRQESA